MFQKKSKPTTSATSKMDKSEVKKRLAEMRKRREEAERKLAERRALNKNKNKATPQKKGSITDGLAIDAQAAKKERGRHPSTVSPKPIKDKGFKNKFAM